jgi:amidase
VADVARLLVAYGHDAVRADPAYPARLTVMGAATWCAIAHREAEGAGELPPRTRRHAALGAGALRRGLVRDGERADWRDRCLAWFDGLGLDLLLTPALAGPPPRALAWSRRPWLSNVGGAVRLAAYAVPWSLAGLPALAVPVGHRRDGLPASVQLVGPPGAEERLLAVAAQLEAATGWRRHAPGWPRHRRRP